MPQSNSLDEPGSGRPLRNKYAADPAAAADHHALSGCNGPAAMTTGRGLPPLGSSDARPPVIRRGAHLCSHLPSRTGQHLRWPDGVVTDLAANQGVNP